MDLLTGDDFIYRGILTMRAPKKRLLNTITIVGQAKKHSTYKTTISDGIICHVRT